MPGHPCHFQLASTQVEHLSFFHIEEFSLIIRRMLGHQHRIGPMHPYFIEILDAAGMVGVHVGDDYFQRFPGYLSHNLIQIRTTRAGINQHGLVFALYQIHGSIVPSGKYPSLLFQQGNLYLFILEYRLRPYSHTNKQQGKYH